MDILNNDPDLSIMMQIIERSSMQHILKQNHHITEICFEKHHCLPITGSLKHQIRKLKFLNQYTIQLIENSALKKAMSHRRLQSLLTNSHKADNFIKKHMFLGMLNPAMAQHKDKRLLGMSLLAKHRVTEIIPANTVNMKAVSHDSKIVYIIDQVIPVKEGLVHILKEYNLE